MPPIVLRNLISLSVLIALSASLALAEDLVTTDGKTYKNIRISGETTDKVKVMHDGGIVLVPKNTLTAEFIAAHELSAPAVSAQSVLDDPQKAALGSFKLAMPTFTSKDGRQFQSSDITDIDPTGLKLRTATGVLRLPFSELPEKVRNALNYDAPKAATFEKALANKRDSDSKMRETINNATSTVDMFGKQVRLVLLQNHGKGWISTGQVIRNVTVDVVTNRAGSPLSGPKVVKEVSKQQETVGVADINRVMVFGLPSFGSMSADIQGRRTWSGKIYRVGNYNWVSASSGSVVKIDACHIDRNEAIRWIVKNGNAGTYTEKGSIDAGSEGSVASASSGTGFGITNDGHIATAAHVVDGASQIDVVIGSQTANAKVIAINKELDVAILRVENGKTKPLYVVPAKTAKIGADLFSVGYPLTGQLGFNAKLTKGVLNALSGLNDDTHTFQMSVQIQPGNSGGPVCDDLGHVIGIVSETTSTIAAARGDAGAIPQNVNFAVKADELLALAKTVNLSLPTTIPAVESATQRVLDSTYLIKVKREATDSGK